MRKMVVESRQAMARNRIYRRDELIARALIALRNDNGEKKRRENICFVFAF